MKMEKRRLILLVILVLMILLCIICDIAFVLTEPEQHNYNPIGIGSFKVIESSTIDPATILSSLNNDDPNIFNFKPGLSEDPLLITSVEWRQEDFINLANSIYRVAWDESESGWKLSRMGYYTDCEHPSGFSSAEFYYHLETPGDRKYYARDILMEPESGYVAWGGDSYFFRPLFSWMSIKTINLKKITVTAEEALRMAEESGGAKARQSWEDCHILVNMWPDVFGHYDWRVYYWDNNAYTTDESEFRIPAK